MNRCVARPAPRPEVARERYDRGARRYDLVTAIVDRPRRLAIERLDLRPGETVLDIACGTGVNFERLLAGVGQSGSVIGIDISAGMLAEARERVHSHDWDNVELIEGDVARTELPATNAALFSCTHDVLRNRSAVEGVVESLSRGGRVAATSIKYARRAAFAVNAVVRLAAPRFVTTLEGLDRPWSHLDELMGPLDVRSFMLGTFYVASGRRR